MNYFFVRTIIFFSLTKVIKIKKKSSIHYFIALYSMYSFSWYVASLNKWRCECADMHDGEKNLIKFPHVSIICILTKNGIFECSLLSNMDEILIRFFCPQNCVIKRFYIQKNKLINVIITTLWLMVYKWLIIMNYGNKKV